jgi:hypothetical protein
VSLTGALSLVELKFSHWGFALSSHHLREGGGGRRTRAVTGPSLRRGWTKEQPHGKLILVAPESDGEKGEALGFIEGR